MLRLIIVDDEEEFVQALTERLGLRGFEARGFVSAEAAAETIDKGDFDIAILDVRMPGLGGLEIIQRIKQRWPDRQVIMITGHGSEEDARRGRELGAFDYLMKPVRLEQLIGILKRAGGI